MNDRETVRSEPFPHMLIPALLPPERADVLLAWLENRARWRFQQTQFYQQFSCSNISDAEQGDGSLFFDLPFLHQTRERMEAAFGVALNPSQIYVCAHRLIRGTGIGIHTDRPRDGMETHRLVAHFTRDYTDANGGHLMFFTKADVSALSTIIRPLHNSAAAFELSERSFHAVNDVSAGVRYSLVFAFWLVGADIRVVSNPDIPPRSLPSEIVLSSGARVGAEAIALLRRLGAHTVPHSGRTLIEHLIGVASILAAWKALPDVVLAGLTHSVYGTPGYPLGIAALAERECFRAVVGELAEGLAFRFAHDPSDDADRATREALALITLANAVEQYGNPQPEPDEEKEILAMLERGRAFFGEAVCADVLERLGGREALR